ncbi:MAG TPA: hypothetical protein PK954_11845 [Anaerolineales bacterium]|nr:hypothetical protein [Anaerolineales bacterium]
MPNDTITPHPSHSPRAYQIKVAGRLSETWAEWFDGLTITHTDQDETLLTGRVVDQAALQGLLKKIRDLGLPLLSVNPVEPSTSDEGGTAHEPSPKE